MKIDNQTIFDAIKNDPENKSYTEQGWNPLYAAPPAAKILIIGQAPSKRVQESNTMWNDKSGDLPPRKGIADKWHQVLLEQMPDIKLTILIGMYAQKYYLNLPNNAKTTEVMQNYQTYLPKYFPIVHPSPRNNIWLAKNDWFENTVVPELQQTVRQILKS